VSGAGCVAGQGQLQSRAPDIAQLCTQELACSGDVNELTNEAAHSRCHAPVRRSLAVRLAHAYFIVHWHPRDQLVRL
jgi:hypothetical protein